MECVRTYSNCQKEENNGESLEGVPVVDERTCKGKTTLLSPDNKSSFIGKERQQLAFSHFTVAKTSSNQDELKKM